MNKLVKVKVSFLDFLKPNQPFDFQALLYYKLTTFPKITNLRNFVLLILSMAVLKSRSTSERALITSSKLKTLTISLPFSHLNFNISSGFCTIKILRGEFL